MSARRRFLERTSSVHDTTGTGLTARAQQSNTQQVWTWVTEENWHAALMVASRVCQGGQVWNSNREEVVFAMTLLSYCANKRQRQLTPHCAMAWWKGLSSEGLGIACANINQVALVFAFMFTGSRFYRQTFEYIKNVNVIQFVYSLDSYSQFVPCVSVLLSSSNQSNHKCTLTGKVPDLPQVENHEGMSFLFRMNTILTGQAIRA